VLDLQHEAGREAFIRLARWADILIENNAPRVFPNLGLSYEELARANPRLVMCSISAFGATGPEASHTGIGPNIEGSSGWVAQTGYGEGDLTATGALQPDPIGGTIAPTVILAALLQRERTGHGQHIDLSLQECASSFVVESIMDFRLSGRIARPLNNRSRRFAPQGVYPSAGDDCWLALAVEGDEQWRALCATIERPDLAAATLDVDARRAAHDEIDDAIAAWSRTLDHNEATRRLQDAGVPAGPVLANWELASDPHLYERGYWLETVHPEVGYERWEGYPWRLSRTPGRARRAAPRYAEHNDEVLREACGLTASEIEELRRSGALMDEPGDTHLFALASASPAAMSPTGSR
ncbi:MAG: CaiB/BaiF CoA-transferase family protein, partial [Chloroflexi bacterium]|nr:CaiB/BaiF CoA-transferase family protein [Chloroflexota bacterium]